MPHSGPVSFPFAPRSHLKWGLVELPVHGNFLASTVCTISVVGVHVHSRHKNGLTCITCTYVNSFYIRLKGEYEWTLAAYALKCCGFSVNPSVLRLWHESCFMRMSIYLS